ncbi:MAG: glutathione S-transferase [Paracoccaceae bacterium]
MKLLMSPASPFVRKVLVLLHETKQIDDVVMQSVQAGIGSTEAALKAANPVGKIPALVRDEGPTLYDSRVICRFFDARAGAGLYPEHGWDSLVLESTADALMDAAVLMVYEARFRPEEKQSVEWIENQWIKVEGALNALNSRWLSHLEAPLDIGHIAVASALGYLDFRHDARNWRVGRDGLANWFERFSGRESMRATVPQG